MARKVESMKKYCVNVYDAYGYINCFFVHADKVETQELNVYTNVYTYTCFYCNGVKTVELTSDDTRKFKVEEDI